MSQESDYFNYSIRDLTHATTAKLSSRYNNMINNVTSLNVDMHLLGTLLRNITTEYLKPAINKGDYRCDYYLMYSDIAGSTMTKDEAYPYVSALVICLEYKGFKVTRYSIANDIGMAFIISWL